MSGVQLDAAQSQRSGAGNLSFKIGVVLMHSRKADRLEAVGTGQRHLRGDTVVDLRHLMRVGGYREEQKTTDFGHTAVCSSSA